MPERIVCSGCGEPATWNARIWAWACPAGEVISEQTGRVIGSLAVSRLAVSRSADRQPAYAWRQVGRPWPASEGADG